MPDGRRLFHEVRAGREQLDADAIARQAVESQDGLDRRDATAGHEYAEWRSVRAATGHLNAPYGGGPRRASGDRTRLLRVSRNLPRGLSEQVLWGGRMDWNN